MKKLIALLMAMTMLFALAACGSSNSTTPDSDAKDTSEPAQEESATPTPEQETSLQDESFEPFFTCSGSGDDVVTGLTTDAVSFLRVTHLDNTHFHVKAHYDDTYDLLVNTSDPYEGGCTLLLPDKEYTLEIGGSGDWQVEACKIGTSSTDSFSVHGDYVTPVFMPTSNVYEIDAPGSGHIDIWVYSDGSRDLLVNTSDGDYHGKVMIDFSDAPCFFTICSERDVTIVPAT